MSVACLVFWWFSSFSCECTPNTPTRCKWRTGCTLTTGSSLFAPRISISVRSWGTLFTGSVHFSVRWNGRRWNGTTNAGSRSKNSSTSASWWGGSSSYSAACECCWKTINLRVCTCTRKWPWGRRRNWGDFIGWGIRLGARTAKAREANRVLQSMSLKIWWKIRRLYPKMILLLWRWSLRIVRESVR